MEGKAVLFKRFADVDAIDIEVDDRGRAALHRCGRIARAELRRDQPRGHRRARLLHHRADAARADEHPGLPRRPARHRDHHRRRADQRLPAHRTASSRDIKVVVNGAGAAAIACTELIKAMGVRGDNVIMCDRKGVIHKDRDGPRPVEVGACGRDRHSARWPRRWSAPTCSSACRRRARSSPRWSRRWPRSRSSSPWPTPIPRSGRPTRRPRGPTRSSPPAARTSRTRSTTSSASRSSSAARSTCARPRSTTR